MQRDEPQVKGLEAQHRKPLEVAQATMAEAHTLAAKQRWVGVVGMCAEVVLRSYTVAEAVHSCTPAEVAHNCTAARCVVCLCELVPCLVLQG